MRKTTKTPGEKIVKDIKGATRKHCSSEEKIRIVLDGLRRATPTDPDGSITVIADQYGGKRLNSPNDVVRKSDGTIWFTDPDHGIMSTYKGFRADREQPGCHVYRVDPAYGTIDVFADDFTKPNGLFFHADEPRLFVADSGRGHALGGPRHVRSFDVKGDNALSISRIFCEMDPGVPDGFRLDTNGNLWSSCQDGVICFGPDGTPLGKIRIPALVSDLTFGGPRRNRLFITATNALYAVYVATRGIQTP